MNIRKPFWRRPTALFAALSLAFASGLMVDPTIRFFFPYYYQPPGLEKTFAPFWETWHLVERYYVDRSVVQPPRLTRAAIEGLLASLGDTEHTAYLSAEDLRQMENTLEGHTEGIGVRLAMRRRLPTITMTVPGSPARAAGLKARDVIIEVNGKRVQNLSLDQIGAMVRGPLGETVSLHVAREGQSKPLEFVIERARVEVPDVSWRILPGTSIAHVAFQSFGKQIDDQLKAALAEMEKKGVKALLLDVRGNLGGRKDQAVAVTSAFIKEGNVLIEQDSEGRQTPSPVIPGSSATDLPLCVLVDHGTASAAEIFAGAIQDHQRGKLIGTRTFGAGTVLNLFSLSDGSAVKIAVSEWLTPNGRRIWHQGITADIQVPLPDMANVMMPEMEDDLTAESLAKCDDKQLLAGVALLRGAK
jgi:carboxyl-terminal processing protease